MFEQFKWRRVDGFYIVPATETCSRHASVEMFVQGWQYPFMIGRPARSVREVCSTPAPHRACLALTTTTPSLAMPRLDDSTHQYLRDAESGVRSTASSAWNSFTSFALRDNVLEVAVGLMCVTPRLPPPPTPSTAHVSVVRP